MFKYDKTIRQMSSTKQLVEVLLAIDQTEDMQDFLGDIMTPKEIVEIGSRLEAARMLQAGSKYTEIVARTKLSSRTIARISTWMQNGFGGYTKVLDKINTHHSHTLPVHAD